MNPRIRELAEQCYEKHELLGTYEFNKEKFAELIRADEREACAKLCDDYPHGMGLTERQLAQAIRARGEK